MPKHSSTCFRTEEENELLIIAVQDYPCLWDPSIEGYSRAQFRSLAWENVAERCGFPGNGEKNFINLDHNCRIFYSFQYRLLITFYLNEPPDDCLYVKQCSFYTVCYESSLMLTN